MRSRPWPNAFLAPQTRHGLIARCAGNRIGDRRRIGPRQLLEQYREHYGCAPADLRFALYPNAPFWIGAAEEGLTLT